MNNGALLSNRDQTVPIIKKNTQDLNFMLQQSRHEIGAQKRGALFTDFSKPCYKKELSSDEDQPISPQNSNNIIQSAVQIQNSQQKINSSAINNTNIIFNFVDDNKKSDGQHSSEQDKEEEEGDSERDGPEDQQLNEEQRQLQQQQKQAVQNQPAAAISNKNITSSYNRKRNFLKVFFYTYQFIIKMKFIHDYRNIFSLTKYHLHLLRDKAYGYYHNKKKKHSIIFQNQFSSYMYYWFKHYLDRINVFLPDNVFIILWNINLLLIILIQLFSIPFQISMDYQFSESANIFFKNISFWFLLCDMIISINLGYYEEGIIVTKRSLIIKKYLKEKFLFELFTTILVQLSGSIQIVFIFRFFQIPFILNKIDEHFQLQYRIPTIFEIMKLLGLIIYVAHWCGCGFRYLSFFNEKGELGWIEKQNLTHETAFVQYLNSLYYAVITMITVGYGDITPVSVKEKTYVVFMTLISCMVFAYVLNAVGAIFQDLAKRNSKFKKQRHEITEYMRARNISKDVQIQVIKYLQYINTRQNEGHQKGEQILLSLSKTIREQVYREFYGGILKNFKMFYLNFSDKFLNALSLHMREITLGPGEILFNQGEIDMRLFYIIKGEIELFIDLEETGQEDITLSQIGYGNYFGQYGFFSQKPRDSSARSINITNLVYCTLDDFLILLKQYPPDYEKYCQLKDSLTLSQQLGLGMKCFSCKKFSHTIMRCPLLHYEVDKPTYLKRYVYSIPQVRQTNKFPRKRKRFHCYPEKSLVSIALKKIRLNLVGDELTQLEEIQDDKYFYKSIPRYIQMTESESTSQLELIHSQNQINYNEQMDEEDFDDDEDEDEDEDEDNQNNNDIDAKQQDQQQQQNDNKSEDINQQTNRSSKSQNKSLFKLPTGGSVKKVNSQLENQQIESQNIQQLRNSLSKELLYDNNNNLDDSEFKETLSNFYNRRSESKKNSNLSAFSNNSHRSLIINNNSGSMYSNHESPGQLLHSQNSNQRVSSKHITVQNVQSSMRDLSKLELSQRKISQESNSKSSLQKGTARELSVIKEVGRQISNLTNNSQKKAQIQYNNSLPAEFVSRDFKTGMQTSVSQHANFQPSEYQHRLQFISLDLDKICEFNNYYDQFNISTVTKVLNKNQKILLNKKTNRKSKMNKMHTRGITNQKSVRHQSSKKSVFAQKINLGQPTNTQILLPQASNQLDNANNLSLNQSNKQVNIQSLSHIQDKSVNAHSSIKQDNSQGFDNSIQNFSNKK